MKNHCFLFLFRNLGGPRGAWERALGPLGVMGGSFLVPGVARGVPGNPGGAPGEPTGRHVGPQGPSGEPLGAPRGDPLTPSNEELSGPGPAKLIDMIYQTRILRFLEYKKLRIYTP